MNGQNIEVTLSVWEILSWVMAGGGIGGVVDVCSRIEYTKDGFKNADVRIDNGVALFYSFLVSIVIGIGGALALQWALLSVGKFESVHTPQNIIFIFTISVVSGFGARRLLPGLRQALEDQMLQNKKEINQIKDEVDETKEIADIALERASESDVISKALSTFDPKFPESAAHESIHELRGLVNKQPTNRYASIILARLLRRCNDIGEGILVLDRFLTAKDGSRELDKDYADVLYNRACYYSVLYSKSKQDEHREKSIQDLINSIKISPSMPTVIRILIVSETMNVSRRLFETTPLANRV